jgi:hypothetical protein
MYSNNGVFSLTTGLQEPLVVIRTFLAAICNEGSLWAPQNEVLASLASSRAPAQASSMDGLRMDNGFVERLWRSLRHAAI